MQIRVTWCLLLCHSALAVKNDTITINQSIDYYSLEEIPVDCEVFEGDSLEWNEIVGDFNGEGKLEKA